MKLPAVQRLQFFLSESVWDPGRLMTVGWICCGPIRLPAPHGGGVLVIDDSGDRKDGTKAAHADGRATPDTTHRVIFHLLDEPVPALAGLFPKQTRCQAPTVSIFRRTA